MEYAMSTDDEIKEWLAARKREASIIDPETVEVFWTYGCIEDPYDIYPDAAVKQRSIGRVHFARRPGGIWVCFWDLPDVTSSLLWERIATRPSSFSNDDDVPF
jgi:hypothetical protein